MATYWYDAANNRYINEETGAVETPSGQGISDARPGAAPAGWSYIPGTSGSSDQAALEQQYGGGMVYRSPVDGNYYAPDNVLAAYSDNSTGGIKGALDKGYGVYALAAALGGAALSGAGGGGAATGAGAYSGGATGAFDLAGLSGTGIPEAWGITGGGGGAGATGATGMDFLNSGFNLFDPSTWGGGVDAASGIPSYNPGILDPGYLSGATIDPTLGASAGAPFQPGYNFLDPSTYGGSSAGGSTSLLDNIRKLLSPGGGGSGGGGGLDLSNLLRGALQGGLGYLGANQQQDAMQKLQDQWLGLGAPSRARFEGSFAPGFDLKEGDAAVGQMWSDLERGASSRYGNPYASPTAQSEILGQVWNRGYLPQLNTYRSQNLTGGQLGTNTAGTAGMAGAQNAGAGLNAIGYGLGTALTPDDPYKQGLAQLLGNNYRLPGNSSF